MALVIITVQDDLDGSIAVKVNTEPHLAMVKAMSPQDFTPAQRLGATALNAIHAELEAAGQRPKIVVAGADEMPPH